MEGIKRDVIVKVDTIQKDDDDKTCISNRYNGTLYEKKGKYFIFYTEYGEEGEKMSDSVIRCDSEFVEIKRSGAYSSILSFKSGEEYKTVYSTPYGGMPVLIKCKKVLSAIDSDGGKIILEYKMNITDNNYENIVTISVKCKD